MPGNANRARSRGRYQNSNGWEYQHPYNHRPDRQKNTTRQCYQRPYHKNTPRHSPLVVTTGPLRVQANFFDLNIPPNTTIARYQVTVHSLPDGLKFCPDNLEFMEDITASFSVSLKRAIFRVVQDAFLCKYQSQLAFDGLSEAYSFRATEGLCSGYLHFDAQWSLCEAPVDRKKVIYTLNIHVIPLENSVISDVNVADFPVSTDKNRKALKVVLAHFTRQGRLQLGSCFYEHPASTPEGLTVIRSGFYQNILQSNMGLLLNITPCFRAFWSARGQRLDEFLLYWVRENTDIIDRQVSTFDDITNDEIENALTRLEGLEVQPTFRQGIFTVRGATQENAENTTLDLANAETSVVEYLQELYSITLRYPTKLGVRTDKGSETFFPIELLQVLDDQTVSGLPLQDLTGDLIAASIQKPHISERRIRDSVGAIQSCFPSGPSEGNEANEVAIKKSMKEVGARVLSSPLILCGGNKTRIVNRGEWKCDSFINPADMQTWILLVDEQALIILRDNVGKFSNPIERFTGHLVRSANSVGMKCTNPQEESVKDEQLIARMGVLAQQHRDAGRKIDLFFLLSGSMDTAKYNNVKRIGDTELWIATQVCTAQTLVKNMDQRRLRKYCQNLVLKINVKLGGRNWIVQPPSTTKFRTNSTSMIESLLKTGPCMILGANIAHPSDGERGCSIAAVVGSTDRDGIQYSTSIRAQKRGVAEITHLADMFKELYKRWKQKASGGKALRAVIMFRDGMCEGQFQMVHVKEVDMLKTAFKNVITDTGVIPKLSYVVVTKEHNARFFVRHQGRTSNIPAGTVIDTVVTNTGCLNFYLCSHNNTRGTSKPSKYSVFLDENELSSAVLQETVHTLTQGFARCMKSVSVVNSLYYAHLLACRARAYLERSDTQTPDGEEVSLPEVGEALAERLFFV